MPSLLLDRIIAMLGTTIPEFRVTKYYTIPIIVPRRATIARYSPFATERGLFFRRARLAGEANVNRIIENDQTEDKTETQLHKYARSFEGSSAQRQALCSRIFNAHLNRKPVGPDPGVMATGRVRELCQ
jgi:hypothetical protein